MTLKIKLFNHSFAFALPQKLSKCDSCLIRTTAYQISAETALISMPTAVQKHIACKRSYIDPFVHLPLSKRKAAHRHVVKLAHVFLPEVKDKARRCILHLSIVYWTRYWELRSGWKALHGSIRLNDTCTTNMMSLKCWEASECFVDPLSNKVAVVVEERYELKSCSNNFVTLFAKPPEIKNEYFNRSVILKLKSSSVSLLLCNKFSFESY